MKIAVTYDNGSVFQHFGKTENFKIFEVENGAIISSEVVGSNGADRKSTRLNSSHNRESRMPSSA